MKYKKLYLALLISALLISFFLFPLLPEDKRHYLVLLPIVFWLIYYIAIYVDQNKKGKESQEQKGE